MWNEVDGDRCILIDKENSIFPNDELTQKGGCNYIINFLPQDAEKYHNQIHVYYFSKNNSKFTLKPYQKEPTQEEIKLRCVGESLDEKGEFSDYAFNNFFEAGQRKDLKLFFISKNHPQIKKLSNKGKLQRDKFFIVRYGKVDEISQENLAYIFNEDNQELEITEA